MWHIFIKDNTMQRNGGEHLDHLLYGERSDQGHLRNMNLYWCQLNCSWDSTNTLFLFMLFLTHKNQDLQMNFLALLKWDSLPAESRMAHDGLYQMHQRKWSSPMAKNLIKIALKWAVFWMNTSCKYFIMFCCATDFPNGTCQSNKICGCGLKMLSF